MGKGLFPLLIAPPAPTCVLLGAGGLHSDCAVTVISSLWSGMTSAESSVAIFSSRLGTDRLEPKASQEAAWCSGERTKPASGD